MSETILVVDDVAYIREPIAAALNAAGYQANCASDGTEALALIRLSKPSLVVLDLEMPGLSGLEVLRQLGRDGEPTPAWLVLTGRQDRASVIKARELGVRHFLLKSSFSLDNLTKRVGLALRERQHVHRPSESNGTPLPISSTPQRLRDLHEASVCTPVGAAPPAIEALSKQPPLLSRAELMHRIERSGQLRAMSPAVHEVLALSQRPSVDTEEVAAAIKRDQAVALKVLKLANSSAYSCGRKVESVDQAVVRIGMDPIRQAVLNLGVIDHFDQQGAGAVLNPMLFWEHSIACGIIAAELAEALGGPAPDAMFTIGLLHDVGRAVLAEQLGDAYAGLLATAERLALPVEVVESRLLGATHAEIAGTVLRAWNIPKNLIEPIANHHSPVWSSRADSTALSKEAAMVSLADCLAHALMLGSSRNETLYSSVDLCCRLGLTASAIRRVEQSACSRTRDLKLALLATVGPGGMQDACEVQRKRLMHPFCPLFVGTSPDIDALRIGCGRLADPGLVEPNIGFVHINCPEERPALLDSYREAERQRGVGHLPVVCFSSDGVGLELGPGRWQRVLPVPVAIWSVIEAINAALSSQPSVFAA